MLWVWLAFSWWNTELYVILRCLFLAPPTHTHTHTHKTPKIIMAFHCSLMIFIFSPTEQVWGSRVTYDLYLGSDVYWQGVLEQRVVKQMWHKTRVMCVLSALLTVLLSKLQTNPMKCNFVSSCNDTKMCLMLFLIVVLQEWGPGLIIIHQKMCILNLLKKHFKEEDHHLTAIMSNNQQLL
jgi:hypothetical protein